MQGKFCGYGSALVVLGEEMVWYLYVPSEIVRRLGLCAN